jgi:tetratricopeptide (TPR) repeat protein
LAGALGTWFYVRAPGEGRRWLEQLLAFPPQAEHVQLRAVALWATARCALAQEDAAVAVAYLEEAAALFRAVEDLPWLSRTLALLGAYVPSAEAARSRALATEALSLAQAVGEPHDTGSAALYAGVAELYHGGDLTAVRAHYEAALRQARALAADSLTLAVLVSLVIVAALQGQQQEARRLQQEALPLAEASGDRYATMVCATGLALSARAEGDQTAAAAAWRRALELARDLGSALNTALYLIGCADVLAHRGQAAGATRLLGVSEALWQSEQSEPFRRHFGPTRAAALAAARAALPPNAFRQAWAEGEALSLEQATDLALAALAELTSAGAVDPAASAYGGETHHD